jgi:hypothetical protein
MTNDRHTFHLIYYMLVEYFVLTLVINPPLQMKRDNI